MTIISFRLEPGQEPKLKLNNSFSLNTTVSLQSKTSPIFSLCLELDLSPMKMLIQLHMLKGLVCFFLNRTANISREAFESYAKLRNLKKKNQPVH
jgi:hypothetical protein